MTETADRVVHPSERASPMESQERRGTQKYFLLWIALAGLAGASLSALALLVGPLFLSILPGANLTHRSVSAPPPAPVRLPAQDVALAAPAPMPMPAQMPVPTPGGAAAPEHLGAALPPAAAASPGQVTAPVTHANAGPPAPVVPALAAVAALPPTAAMGAGAQGGPGGRAPVATEPPSRVVVANTPVAAAQPAGSPNAAAGGAVLAGVQSRPVERPLSDRQLLESMQVSLETLNAKVLEVAQNERKNTDAVTKLRSDLKRVSNSAQPPKVKLPDEAFLLSIFDISASGVVVSDNGKRVTVLPGGKLPGGLIFIGFDPATRKMKTDQGEFSIPG